MSVFARFEWHVEVFFLWYRTFGFDGNVQQYPIHPLTLCAVCMHEYNLKRWLLWLLLFLNQIENLVKLKTKHIYAYTFRKRIAFRQPYFSHWKKFQHCEKQNCSFFFSNEEQFSTSEIWLRRNTINTFASDVRKSRMKYIRIGFGTSLVFNKIQNFYTVPNETVSRMRQKRMMERDETQTKRESISKIYSIR